LENAVLVKSLAGGANLRSKHLKHLERKLGMVLDQLVEVIPRDKSYLGPWPGNRRQGVRLAAQDSRKSQQGAGMDEQG
jgi:hypothetical protein